jgi:two-component system cell cycle sensor histidine kinase/response regulator CckA
MGHRSASDSGSTVLVIDDDADVRIAAERVLRRHGFTVLVASDGAEGIELLQREAGIGIVLLDLNMPGLGGAETARELGRIRPGISLIVMSGDAEGEVRERLQDVNLAGFVPKPFTIDELLAVVRGLRGG